MRIRSVLAAPKNLVVAMRDDITVLIITLAIALVPCAIFTVYTYVHSTHQLAVATAKLTAATKENRTLGLSNRSLTLRVAAVQQTQRSAAKTQLANRTKNVYTWCNAINSGRDYDRALVRRFHVAYTLADLPCKKLATNTEKSAKPK